MLNPATRTLIQGSKRLGLRFISTQGSGNSPVNPQPPKKDETVSKTTEAESKVKAVPSLGLSDIFKKIDMISKNNKIRGTEKQSNKRKTHEKFYKQRSDEPGEQAESTVEKGESIDIQSHPMKRTGFRVGRFAGLSNRFGEREQFNDGERRPYQRRDDGERRPYQRRDDGERRPYQRRDGGEGRPYQARDDGERRPYQGRDNGERRPYQRRDDGERRPYQRRDDGERSPYQRRDDGERRPFQTREDGERIPFQPREDGERIPFQTRDDGETRPYQRRDDGERRPYQRRDDGERRPNQRRDDGRPPRSLAPRRDGGDRRGGPPRGDRRPAGPPKTTVAPEIQSKELSASPLKPTINAETFFYGKIPSSNAGISSRLASVAKLTLEDSKYPYLLPRHIIERAAENPTNQFILQKNWSLKVNHSKLAERVKHMVRGDLEVVNTENANDKELAKVTSDLINSNGSLDIQQKQFMFDIVNGTIRPRDLLKDAHWNQKK
ncbi:uncharacterized protein J8A68_005726 [[Candida] subhashii]|uniref:Uncharacterized protein n=1 Tax=[Candida] subhashii TaxID=561895 RepID=A0A8J5Q246_9ASCO|nr:uncharacterized protein J8A68_005726 [[Candida] subhashii]KAG7660764.1 hypothetical protein J8A68_005726 [[Candida] subhashii]